MATRATYGANNLRVVRSYPTAAGTGPRAGPGHARPTRIALDFGRRLRVMDNWQPKRTRESVKAIYDDQLTAYLRSLGLNPDGELGLCKFDRTPVTVDNLAALFPLSGSLKLVCSHRECLAGLQDLISQGVVRL